MIIDIKILLYCFLGMINQLSSLLQHLRKTYAYCNVNSNSIYHMVENCLHSTFINIFNYEKHSFKLAHIIHYYPQGSPVTAAVTGPPTFTFSRVFKQLWHSTPVYITPYITGGGGFSCVCQCLCFVNVVRSVPVECQIVSQLLIIEIVYLQ